MQWSYYYYMMMMIMMKNVRGDVQQIKAASQNTH